MPALAGQAARWFDVVPAARGFRRVLRPGGALARVPDRVRPAGTRRSDVVDSFAAALQADVAVSESGTVQRLTPDDVVGDTATRSSVAVLDQAPDRPSSTAHLLADHPDTRGVDLLDLPCRLTPR